MAKGKSMNIGFILGLVVLVLGIAGGCMVFLPLLTTESSGTIFGTSLKGVTSYPGLGVVFGGTHSVTSVLSVSGSATSTSVDVDFKFNTIGFLAMLLPVLGAILVCINGLVTKKIPFCTIVGLLLIVVGIVLCFFVPSGFKAVNETGDIDLKYGIGLILMIVFFGLALLGSLAKLFLADFKK